MLPENRPHTQNHLETRSRSTDRNISPIEMKLRTDNKAYLNWCKSIEI